MVELWVTTISMLVSKPCHAPLIPDGIPGGCSPSILGAPRINALHQGTAGRVIKAHHALPPVISRSDSPAPVCIYVQVGASFFIILVRTYAHSHGACSQLTTGGQTGGVLLEDRGHYCRKRFLHNVSGGPGSKQSPLVLSPDSCCYESASRLE